MAELEQLLGLFVAAVILAALARRVGAPYPVSLALGGGLLAFLPAFNIPPEVVLALFVAPVLLDAYDSSLRDLQDNWAVVIGLGVFAVGNENRVCEGSVGRCPCLTWPPERQAGSGPVSVSSRD